MSERHAIAALLVALAAAACPPVAAADDLHGTSPRATALGGAMTARTGDTSAVYYNPAALSPGGETARAQPGFAELTLAFLYAHPQLHARYEVEGTPPEGAPADGERLPLATGVPNTRSLLIATRFDLGHLFGVRGLHMAFSAYTPVTDIFRWYAHPDDRPTWLMWTDRSQHVVFRTAMAYRIAPWLSAGLGLQILFDVETLTSGRVVRVLPPDPVTGEIDIDVQLGEDVTVFGHVAPTAGLLFTPHDRLRIGLSYRARILVNDWGWTRVDGVPGLGALGYVHHFAHYYDPHQLTLGVSADPVDGLTVSADLTWGRWSTALSSNHVELGKGRAGDTLVPSLGVSWEARPGLTLMGGYRYVRSPVNNAGGETNLLDNDRHVVSLGTDLHVGNLLGRDDLPFSFQLAFQATVLPDRHEVKDYRRFESDSKWFGNPGFPGYRHGGWVPALWAGAEVLW